MSTFVSNPAPKRKRTLPLSVVAVALYQLAKMGFFLYVFWQCWQLRGTEIPPFGDVRNPFYKEPGLFLFPLLAGLHFVLAVGLICLGNWARACLTLLVALVLALWLLHLMSGESSFLFTLEPSIMISAFAAEIIAVAILYVTPHAKAAFAPATK
jgi:hypothetical protein